METDGRVELGESKANALMLSKLVHVCVLVLAVPFEVWVGGNGNSYSASVVGRYLPIFAFWVAGAMEAIVDAGGAVMAFNEVVKATVARVWRVFCAPCGFFFVSHVCNCLAVLAGRDLFCPSNTHSPFPFLVALPS